MSRDIKININIMTIEQPIHIDMSRFKVSTAI